MSWVSIEEDRADRLNESSSGFVGGPAGSLGRSTIRGRPKSGINRNLQNPTSLRAAQGQRETDGDASEVNASRIRR